MNHKLIPKIPISHIFEVLGKTPAGESLKNTVRFNVYRDSESIGLWKMALGPSAITYSHMIYMHALVNYLLHRELTSNPGLFTADEHRELLLAAACHDFGEAIINGEGIGDVSDPYKNEELEEKEADMFQRVLFSLDLDSELKKEMFNSYQSVIRGGNKKMYDYFRGVEQMEYIMTGSNIFRQKENIKIKNGAILIGSVLAVSIKPTIEKAKKFLSIREILSKNKKAITGMFKHSKEKYTKIRNPMLKKPGAAISPALKSWQQYRKSL
ncbi:MAG TPA: hypothetical protein VI432_00905 [Candidatus Paceibacterota bacterium]